MNHNNGNSDLPVNIIVTGGTFEKTYNQKNGVLDFGSNDTAALNILNLSRVDKEYYTLTRLELIDSLEMTDEYRHDIARETSLIDEDYTHLANRFVIVHGTDTMAETAVYLSEKIGDKKVVIVLTGAMQPHFLGNSDAGFNLGYALACAQIMPPGVYIAMNGRCHQAGTVLKDKNELVFKEK